MFKKICFVLFVLGLGAAVGLVWMGDRKIFFWVLVVAGLIQVVGKLR